MNADRRFKKMAGLTACIFSLLIIALFNTSCVFSDGGSDKETYSIFGTWETTNEIDYAELPDSRKIEIFSGAKIVLNEDNTFSYDFRRYFCWPQGGGYACAPDDVSASGTYSNNDDRVFTFSFIDGNYSYTYTIRYSNLTADSVNLECTMYSEKTDDSTLTATDTFTFKCIRK